MASKRTRTKTTERVKRLDERAKRSDERTTRPNLPRTEPIRSWSGLFGTAAAPNVTRAAVDSVQRGVELGYRVIEDYIKQGASMAGSFTGPATARAPAAGDLTEMTERMVKYASDFTSLWFDAMGSVMTAASGPNAASAASGAAQRPPAADPAASSQVPRGHEAEEAPSPVRLALHVHCRTNVEVILMLDDAGEVGKEWSVGPLRRRGSDAVMAEVSIGAPLAAGGPLRISVEVPHPTPPGRYAAAVVEQASGQPRGRVTVVVSA